MYNFAESYKHLLNLKPTIDDLGDIDSVYFTSLKWIFSNDITDIIYETFSVTIDMFGEKKSYRFNSKWKKY